VGVVRVHLQAEVLDAQGRGEVFAPGRIGPELAQAERDLTGRPCAVLAATPPPASTAIQP
jgi:hypothetical protein